MRLNLLKRIRRHAAMASGDFATLFESADIPPLPEAAARLVTEIHRAEPDLQYLGKLIAASPEISARVLQTVNSSLFALRSPVLSVQHAISLLGLRHLRPIILANAMRDALPRPKGSLFDHQGFWVDSLSRAIVARGLARERRPGSEDTAFTVALICDVALPVLLECWNEYYSPIMTEWRDSSRRLSELEQETFGWDHAQAGAWILQSWGFPEELVCFVGVHNRTEQQLHELELTDSIAPLISVTTRFPSCQRFDVAQVEAFRDLARQRLQIAEPRWDELMRDALQNFEDICTIFGLQSSEAGQVLAQALIDPPGEDEEVA